MTRDVVLQGLLPPLACPTGRENKENRERRTRTRTSSTLRCEAMRSIATSVFSSGGSVCSARSVVFVMPSCMTLLGCPVPTDGARLMNNESTSSPELNGVLRRFVGDVLDILGDKMVGAYVQGSFALNEGDEHSDCDFLVVLYEDPTPEQLGHLMLLHDAIPVRAGHWAKHLEGSYAIASELRNLDGLGREWWYVDHGWRSMQRSTHCNLEIVRCTMREHGITLSGPAPCELVDPVPPEAMRDRMRQSLQTVVPDILSGRRWTSRGCSGTS